VPQAVREPPVKAVLRYPRGTAGASAGCRGSVEEVASIASSDGAVDSMHDSFMPLSGLVLMANMMLDEVIVGGPGSGLFGILLFVFVAVFAAGLMIGRTLEYLGKKIEANEVKMAVLALLCVPAAILGLTAAAAVLPAGLAGLNNAGPHGFFRDPLRLHLGRGDERRRFCRPQRQHPVLQPNLGDGDSGPSDREGCARQARLRGDPADSLAQIPGHPMVNSGCDSVPSDR
jgi:hypothetical protein